MTTTNLTNLLVNGVPTIGTGGLLPFTGNYFFVNESTGSDGNLGTADNPYSTLAFALSKCVSGNNDVIFVTGTVHTSATIAWSLDKTHLVGLAAPSNNSRSRISQTGASVFTPLVNVTGQGCIFMNMATFHGFADASTQICWADSGGRNAYMNCQLFGMGNATAAAQAGSRSLLISGNTGENKFYNCTIGLDTVTRATNTNATLEFTGASPRNEFYNCTFQSYITAAADVHVLIGSGGIDRYVLFDNCLFVNAVGSGATAMSGAFNVNASAGGSVIYRYSTSVGATHLEASVSGKVVIDGGAPTALTTGLAIAPSNS